MVSTNPTKVSKLTPYIEERSLWDTLYELQQNTQLCDSCLCAGGANFPVHRAVMAACSPFFRALFTCALQKKNTERIEVHGVQKDVLKCIIQVAYNQDVSITANNVERLLPIADQYHIPRLLRLCCAFLKRQLSASNCIGIMLFAEQYNCVQLKADARRYVLSNFEEVTMQSSEFLDLTIDVILELIGSDELNVHREERLWKAVCSWVEHKPDDRSHHVSDLLQKVRLGLIDTDVFVGKIAVHPLLKDRDDCQHTLLTAWQSLCWLDSTDTSDIDLSNSMLRPRVPRDVLFAFGGWSGGSPICFFETYDTRADRWFTQRLSEQNIPRAYHGLVTHNQKLYMIGGFDGLFYFNSVMCFDPLSKQLYHVAPMYHQRCYLATASCGDYVYACGGYDGRQRLKTSEKFEPESNQWTLTSPMNIKRSDADMDSLNEKLFICGGFDGDHCLQSAEMYDPATDQWTLLPYSMSVPRSGVSVVTYRSQIYAIGGFDGHHRLDSVEAFNGRSGWTQAAKMYRARSNFAACVLDDMIFAIGGFNGSFTIPHVECYDGTADEWLDAQDMNVNRSALCACVVSDLPNVRDFTYHGQKNQRAGGGEK